MMRVSLHTLITALTRASAVGWLCGMLDGGKGPRLLLHALFMSASPLPTKARIAAAITNGVFIVLFCGSEWLPSIMFSMNAG